MKKVVAIVLVLTCMLAIAGCTMGSKKPEKQLLGKWMDSAGTSGYEFFESGAANITYVNFTIPIINIEYDGTVAGAYTLDTDAMQITVTYSIYGKDVNRTYGFSVNEATLVLTDLTENTSSTYFRVEAETTTEP